MSQIMDYALEKESEGDYQDALNYFEMVMEEKGCPFDIRKDMGRVLNKMGRYTEALNDFDLVLNMDENHSECWFGKGISNLGMGNWYDSYNSFVKSIKCGENENANNWYYLMIIGSSLNEVNDSIIKDFFKRFKRYDNDEFNEIRSKYKFGLYFDYLHNKFFNLRTINIEGFFKELNRYGLNPDEIMTYLKTLSYEELIEKIKFLKEIQHEKITKQIISKEMNLSIGEINDLLELTSLEDIKKEVSNDVHFPNLDLHVNIPLYERTPFEKFIHKNMTDDFKFIRNISIFNTFIEILDSIDRTDFSMKILNQIPLKLYPRSYMYHIQESNKYFENAKIELSTNNYKNAIKNLKDAFKYCPPDYYNIINLEYYYAIFYAMLDDENYKNVAYKTFKKLERNFDYFKNKDIFILNLANLAYDLSLFNLAFIDEALINYYKYLEYHPDNIEVKYLIKTLQVYKSNI